MADAAPASSSSSAARTDPPTARAAASRGFKIYNLSSYPLRVIWARKLPNGAAGHDRLVGGAGNDTPHGGPGRDTLDGGPGADTIIDLSGPTVVHTGTNTGSAGGHDVVNVRDGRGDDTVLCGSRRSSVLADPGDRVAGSCRRLEAVARRTR